MTERRFTLRIDEKIFEQVQEFATQHKRSVAKEFEFMVEQYLLTHATTPTNKKE